MSSLYKRATPTQARILRVIQEAEMEIAINVLLGLSAAVVMLVMIARCEKRL